VSWIRLAPDRAGKTRSSERMDTQLLIIVLVVMLLVGGGVFGARRWR
jgi:hypothetical protein